MHSIFAEEQSLDTEFVKLVKQADNSKDFKRTSKEIKTSRENALKCKSEEQQGEHKNLKKSLYILEEKR